MTVPNALSAARAALVVPVVGLIAIGDFSLALLLFVGAAATDALDGPLARRRDQVTPLGAAIDPLADKILVTGALAALALRGIAPTWAVLLICMRELFATMVRARSTRTVGATVDGKAKTVLQVVAVAALLVAAGWPSAGLTPLANTLLGTAVALTVLSGVRLVLRARQITTHAG